MRGEDSAWGQIKTRTGRVVYDRKKNTFDIRSIDRVLLKYSADINVEVLRHNASHVRAIHKLAANLFTYVLDLFGWITHDQYQYLKQNLRATLDYVGWCIFHGMKFFGAPPMVISSLLPLALVTNRLIETLFTGSTDWDLRNIGRFPDPVQPVEPVPEEPPPEEAPVPPETTASMQIPGLGGRYYGDHD